MLKIGIFGVGHLGKFHLNNWTDIKNVELVGFFDPEDQTAREVTDKYQLPRFNDAERLMDVVDVVDVVAPTTFHYELCKMAIRKGKHVFVEKPLANTMEEAAELVKLVKESNIKLQVGHVERFNPAYLAVKNLELHPMFIEVHRLAQFNPRGTEVSVILDLMIHDIDLIQYIAGSNIERIEAVGAAVITNKPDLANARIRFESGCVANVTASRTSLKVERKVRIFQQNCYFSADLHQKTVSVYRKGESTIGDVRVPITIETLQCDDGDALRLEIESFLDAVRDGTPPVVSGEDGRRALETAMDIVAQVEDWTRSH